jgi:hypothetical protein
MSFPRCGIFTPPISAGEETFGVAPDALREVTLRAADRRIDARRWTSAQPFFFVFESSNGAKFERCIESPPLAKALSPLTSIKALRVLNSEATRQFTKNVQNSEWVDLTIADTVVETDPFHLRLLPPNGKRNELFAKRPGDDWGITVDSDLLSLLTLDCSAR